MAVNGRVILAADELHELLGDPRLVVLDARFDIDDEAQAAVTFRRGHIPGARQADLGQHMAGPIVPGVTGRRPLPDKATFEAQIRAWGIDDSSMVVIYDDMNGIMAASRLWFMLRWAGFDGAALVDGGLTAWVDAGYDLSSGAGGLPEPSTYRASFDDRLVCSLEELRGMVTTRRGTHFDARASTDGVPSHDAVLGRIPNSKVASRADNTRDGRWQGSELLRRHYADVLQGVESSDAVFYCGSGVTAAQNMVGLAHAGLPLGRMYVGGFSEWLAVHEDMIERVDHI
jgi:thiosulfate/3-mercaptopyruvate sulfurtransferase